MFFFCGYMIRNLLLCLAHFTLLANVTIILCCRKLLQECHITSRYTQLQCVAVNKGKWKYKKKSQLCAHGLFYMKFSSQQPLSEAFFHGMRIFGGVGLKHNVSCCLSTPYFHHITLSSTLAPLKGEIDICAHGLFHTKFNSQQLLTEAFFHGMRIFGVGVLCACWQL